MTHRFSSELVVAHPREEVFAFFSSAENLQKLTPSTIGFQILTPTPIDMKVGTLIDYRLRLFGLPVKWRTRISRWDPPHEFADEQLRGPYKQWIHTHRFVAEGDSTRVIDDVLYELPLSPLGDIAYPLVRFQVGKIFEYRTSALRDIFPGAVAG